MKKLKQIAEGEYFLENTPVNPTLDYGPIMYTYNFTDNVHSRGISVQEQNGKKT